MDLVVKAWSMVAVLMLMLWLIQVKTKNASYVDIGWTIGLGICAVVYVSQAQGVFSRKMIMLSIVLAWCIRLSILLVARLIKNPLEDDRYGRIRREWRTGQNLKFFAMFQFQAFLDVILSWPLLLVSLNPDPVIRPAEFFGIACCVIGLVGESIADYQLYVFKNDLSKKGQTCDIGLWYYSRHPNYFFEWLIWAGYFFLAVNAPLGITALIAPILMIFFLLKVSGIPLAEAQAIKTRGEAYKAYQATTSMFVPWFKKKT